MCTSFCKITRLRSTLKKFQMEQPLRIWPVELKIALFFRILAHCCTILCLTLHIIILRIDTIKNDDINPVWCFLENVRDPSDSQSGCYSDTRWSSRDGRFWSSEACKGLPPLSFEGIDELQVSQYYLYTPLNF